MAKICEVMGIPFQVESFAENLKVDVKRVSDILSNDKSFTLTCVCHCETSSGVINPVEEVGQIVKENIPGKNTGNWRKSEIIMQCRFFF